jgi:integrase|nr:MAG TPA: Integrase [Caudoviricetes sp.]
MASIKRDKDKRGNIVYRVSASNGRGRRVSRTFRPEPTWSARTTKRELQKFAAELELQLAEGEIATKAENAEQKANEAAESARTKTLRQYGEQIFLPEKTLSLSEKSRDSYTQLLEDHVFNALGESMINEVSPAQLKALFMQLRSEMAYSSVVKIYAVTNELFKYAMMDDTIKLNPMDKVSRPKQSKDDEVNESALFYTPDEVRYIISCLENEPLKWRVYVLLLVDTGCRRGEISGIRWKSIDFNSSTIMIDRNILYTPSKGIYVSTPKGRKRRIVDVSPEVLSLLKELQENQEPKSEWVFTQRGRTDPMHPDSPNQFFDRFERKYNVKDFHPHKLRHTSASIAITNGADVVSVAARLGHSDSSTTLRMYAHANEDSIRRVGDVFRNALVDIHSDNKEH